MEIRVSGVTTKNGEKFAYVSFQSGERYAEAIIPDCKFIRNDGFEDDEIAQMTDYLKSNLMMLKKEASGVNPLKCIMKD